MSDEQLLNQADVTMGEGDDDAVAPTTDEPKKDDEEGSEDTGM